MTYLGERDELVEADAWVITANCEDMGAGGIVIIFQQNV